MKAKTSIKAGYAATLPKQDMQDLHSLLTPSETPRVEPIVKTGNMLCAILE